ncbi:MAG: Endonuclease/exonuclease/phosphatase [Mucilaginibacter sp.]|nr:Endonuclease/exonuclease/phosphatase [Mucilaginibacter sp.]
METIREYAIPPWEPCLQTIQEPNQEKVAEIAKETTGIVVATSSSVKKGIVGMGDSAQDTLFNWTSEAVINYAVTLGTRDEQNPYTAELAAIAMALKSMPPSVSHRHITIITRIQSALAAINQTTAATVRPRHYNANIRVGQTAQAKREVD